MTLHPCPTFGMVFDEAKHIYTVHGERLPSVTGILDRLVNFSRVDRDVLERARLRGTHVHHMIELYENDDLDLASLTPELEAYLDQYQRFKYITGFKPIIVEGRTWSQRYRFAGSWDLFGTIDGNPRLIDTKAGMVPKTAGLQLAAYKQLGIEAGVMPRTTRRHCLDLKANSWAMTPEYREGSRDLDVFLAQLTVYQWDQQHRKAA